LFICSKPDDIKQMTSKLPYMVQPAGGAQQQDSNVV